MKNQNDNDNNVKVGVKVLFFMAIILLLEFFISSKVLGQDAWVDKPTTREVSGEVVGKEETQHGWFVYLYQDGETKTYEVTKDVWNDVLINSNYTFKVDVWKEVSMEAITDIYYNTEKIKEFEGQIDVVFGVLILNMLLLFIAIVIILFLWSDVKKGKNK